MRPDLSLPELSRQLAHYGSWAAYLETERGQVEGELIVEKGSYEAGLREAIALYDGEKNMTETAKRARAHYDHPVLDETLARVTGYEARLAQLRGQLAGVRMAYETASRIVTVRQLEIEVERRP